MDIEPLRWHSDRLRQMAVDFFEGRGSRQFYLSGRDKMTCEEMLAAMSEQYDKTPQKYLDDMRKPSEWGGGPEIVALANILRRPIHVYELQDAREGCNNDKSNGGGASLAEDGASRPQSRSVSATSTTASGDGRRVVVGTGSSSISSGNGGSGRGGAPIALTSQSGVALAVNKGWKLRRIACFGSPRYDHCHAALHILSADSRFPDVRPGDQLAEGNHFLALFPVDHKPAAKKGKVAGGGAQKKRGGFVATTCPKKQVPPPPPRTQFWRAAAVKASSSAEPLWKKKGVLKRPIKWFRRAFLRATGGGGEE
jgi:hypothetical protein